MSGPKGVRDAVLPDEGPVHSMAEVRAVISAVALAMGRKVEFSAELNREIDKDCSSDEGLDEPDVNPMMPAETDLVASGQPVAAAVHQQSVGGGVRLESVQEVDVGMAKPLSCPDEGLGVSSGGWKVVGKQKGKRRK